MALAPACPPDDATATDGAHLLARGYERLTALCEPLRLDVRRAPEPSPDPTPGSRPPATARPHDSNSSDVPSIQRDARHSLEELAAEPALLAAFLDAEEARIAAGGDAAPRRHVVAARALHGCLWSVSLLLSGPWYLDRRVPLLGPGAVRLDLAGNRYEVTPGGFVCLPGDPAAHVPGVVTVSDEEALRTELRDGFAALVRPLLAAIGPWFRRGPRALWGMAGDDLVSGIWSLGRALGEEERAARQAGDVLPYAVEPFPAGADFRRLEGGSGRGHLTRTRTGCCLYYAIRPAEACGTCPRTGDAERLRRLEC
ncbi:(2Fe-2S)-binding protein [Streptomyces sp. NPDC057702]|uniref:(2Fe-2S)-binding protein n=1 Tax=unclassified Streptomyces TaxID=2593676 RepID=UPI0036932C19